MSDDEQTVFKTDLECYNCGNEWDREYPPGTRVKNKANGVLVGFNDWITCPVCDRDGDVTVVKRSPLEVDPDA